MLCVGGVGSKMFDTGRGRWEMIPGCVDDGGGERDGGTVLWTAGGG